MKPDRKLLKPMIIANGLFILGLGTAIGALIDHFINKSKEEQNDEDS